MRVEDKEFKVLFHEEEIQKRVKELAEQISNDYKDKKPVLIGVLKGCTIFFADLVREIVVSFEMDFIRARSYKGELTSNNVPEFTMDVQLDINGRDVLVIDDILDKGYTLNRIANHLMKKGAKSVRICVLLEKQGTKETDVKADYIGFKTPNKFVVGYGLDYKELGRNLREIFVLKE